MPERSTAETQLATLLQILPLAARRSEGISLSDLATRLGIDEREVAALLTQVTTRSFYLPGGTVDDFQVEIGHQAVSVWTTGEFRRPVRLSQSESLAVALGLRLLGAEAGPEKDQVLLDLAQRLEGQLLHGDGAGDAGRFEVYSGLVPSGGVHQKLAGAARDKKCCRISYLKPGNEPEERRIDPYVLLGANGNWYAVGWCHLKGAIRVFRVDRVLSIDVLSDDFQVVDGFEAGDYITLGRVFRAGDFREVAVLYSARVARRIAEAGAVETLDDGSVIVRYSVADPKWIVRHVLEHGPDAMVLEPEEVREAVEASLRSVLAAVDGES